MKQLHQLSAYMTLLIMSTCIFYGCQKQIDQPRNQESNNEVAGKARHGHLVQTKEYNSDVVLKWMDAQLELMRTSSPFIGGLPVSRIYGYSGIALYESVVPGMPAYQSLATQLNEFPAGSMPKTAPGYAYNWAASANAALAVITRSFFPNKPSVDALEQSLNKGFSTEDADVLARSIAFGQKVGQIVAGWASSDGANHANDAYTPPAGDGMWVPTPPAFAVPFGPYWKNNRLMVAGSLKGIDAVPAPPKYSEDPSSDFYKMVKETHDVCASVTPDQKATGLYYRDNPGYGGGHYISILKLVLQKANSQLDVSALAYAKSGLAVVDAGIGCWTIKYTYNVLRPITYIQKVLHDNTWAPLFATPNHPDYLSGHSTLGGAVAETLTSIFGDNFAFDNTTYRYLNMPDQHYSSLYDMADQIGKSRVYAGIHYTTSCIEGNKLGKKVAQNIMNTVKFEKE
jgi:hypothetical protein